jgi:hypothetical protein
MHKAAVGGAMLARASVDTLNPQLQNKEETQAHEPPSSTASQLARNRHALTERMSRFFNFLPM